MKGKYARTGTRKKAEWIVKGCLVICKKRRRAEERKPLRDFIVLREGNRGSNRGRTKEVIIQLEEGKGARYSDNFKAGSKVNEIKAVWTASTLRRKDH